MSMGQQADNEHLVALIQAGEDEAENMLQLWQQNRGFITTMARKYAAGAEVEDLEQEGYIGLCEAVPHYDPDRGMSFISYAAFWIKRRMRVCADNSRTVRLSFNAGDNVRQYQKVMRQYQQEYGCEPSDRELCGFLCVSQKKLKEIRQAVQTGQIRSLDEPIRTEDGELSLLDVVPSQDRMEEDACRRLDRERLKEAVWLAVDQLPGNQPAVLRMIYLDGMNRREAGERLGVSLGKARDIELRALRTFRNIRRGQAFRAYYEEYLAAAPIRHQGIRRFHETWTSEVEREALRWAEKELRI